MKNVIAAAALLVLGFVGGRWSSAVDRGRDRYEVKTIAGLPVRIDKATGKAEVMELQLPAQSGR